MEFPPHGFPRHARYRLCLRDASRVAILRAMTYNVYSFSGLSTAAECSEKFRLTRIEQVPEQKSFAMFAGTAFHSAADIIDQMLLQDEIPPF
jgi:hypothetical protein